MTTNDLDEDNYTRLRAGETIRAGDEFLNFGSGWTKSTRIGEEVHGLAVYRRPKQQVPGGAKRIGEVIQEGGVQYTQRYLTSEDTIEEGDEYKSFGAKTWTPYTGSIGEPFRPSLHTIGRRKIVQTAEHAPKDARIAELEAALNSVWDRCQDHRLSPAERVAVISVYISPFLK